ncbi:MAG: hydantoinase/oxoprolinase N-terminal domain-containing protein [Trebonia sp.]
MAYVIGVDVGGTFTDAVLDDDAGTVLAAKSPSTPPDYSRGVIDVLDLLAEQLGISLQDMLAGTHHIAHGTTSSLNALVMGNVPPVGFLTTKGHRDSIFIMNVEGRYLGRSPHELQNVLGQAKDHALLPKRHALEVTERVDRDGAVVVPLDEEQARAAIRSLLDDGIRAIAVSLLWSFRNPVHERRLRELVAEQDPAVFVALSSEISPRIREFSRNATAIMSTQIGPGLRDYLTALEDTLRAFRLTGPLLVMQSNGGAVTAREAPATAISTIGSVLTGGPLDAAAIEAAAAAFEQRYAALYGADTGFREAGIQAISFRVRGTGVLPFSPALPDIPAASSPDPAAAQAGSRPVCLDAALGFTSTPVYDYRQLRAGHLLTGPAIVEVPTTTVVIPGGTTAAVDALGNLTIRPGPKTTSRSTS